MKNKRFKFIKKMFKLYIENEYTYDYKIYGGKEKDSEDTASTSVVMKLM